jgi:hypothetical protein
MMDNGFNENSWSGPITSEVKKLKSQFEKEIKNVKN